MDDFGERFDIRVDESPDSVMIAPSGDIDLASAPLVAAALRSSEQDPRDLVLDLEGVSFIDSSGIGVLLAARDRRAGARRRMRIRAVSDPVLRAIRVAGLESPTALEAGVAADDDGAG